MKPDHVALGGNPACLFLLLMLVRQFDAEDDGWQRFEGMDQTEDDDPVVGAEIEVVEIIRQRLPGFRQAGNQQKDADDPVEIWIMRSRICSAIRSRTGGGSSGKVASSSNCIRRAISSKR